MFEALYNSLLGGYVTVGITLFLSIKDRKNKFYEELKELEDQKELFIDQLPKKSESLKTGTIEKALSDFTKLNNSIMKLRYITPTPFKKKKSYKIFKYTIPSFLKNKETSIYKFSTDIRKSLSDIEKYHHITIGVEIKRYFNALERISARSSLRDFLSPFIIITLITFSLIFLISHWEEKSQEPKSIFSSIACII